LLRWEAGMKNHFLKAFQYLVITIFVSFLMYLVNPLFPGVSKSFVRLATRINDLIKTDISPNILAIMLALVLFMIVYVLLTHAAVLFRKKAGIEWASVNPMVRYASVPFSVIKTILIILSIPLIYGYSRVLYETARGLVFSSHRVLAFAAGFAIWSVLWLIFWRKWGFFSILEHEITHMIMGLCFLHRPKKLVVVENEGGWVQLAGVNFLITLAPYYLLTLCFLMLPFFLIIQPQYYLPYFFIMGALASYHTFSTIRETGFNRQPDIIFTGKVFSFFIIFLGNIFCYGFILAFVQGGFPAGSAFIASGWNSGVGLIAVAAKRLFR